MKYYILEKVMSGGGGTAGTNVKAEADNLEELLKRKYHSDWYSPPYIITDHRQEISDYLYAWDYDEEEWKRADGYDTNDRPFQVGDKVLLEREVISKSYWSIEKIERITPTGRIKLVGRDSYFRQNGSEITKGYHSDTIRWYTKKDVDEIERRILVALLRDADFSKVNLHNLRVINNILQNPERLYW